MNVRNEPIISEIPSIKSDGELTGKLTFPRFADGPEIATQFFVLHEGTASTRGKIEFFSEKGEPLSVVLR